MKTFSKLLIILSLVGSFVACEQQTSTGALSTVAQITAFKFTANDSFPGLAEATFVVEQLSDTGKIRMRLNDSVRYGTPINAIIPSITYYTTPSAVTFYLGDSAVALTGYDTLDLSIKPIRIRVIAQNRDYEKWYKLEFDVHTQDGDLFIWDTLQTQVGRMRDCTQKALLHKNKFYYFFNDQRKTELYISGDRGNSWTEMTDQLSGLPEDCNVRQIVEGDSLMFYGRDTTLYYSSNGYTWHSIRTAINIRSLYMCMHTNNAADPVRIWFSAYDANQNLRFYTVGNDLVLREQAIGLSDGLLPADFPVEDYATIPFTSSSLHQHALIVGGYDRNGNMVNARWNLEYNTISQKYSITNMANGNTGFTSIAGTSVCYYGEFMYLIGGIVGNDRTYLNQVYTSFDEGVHWTAAVDSINRKRPENVKGRSHTSTFVYGTDVYIIGGEDLSTTYSDVYRGRMNSIAWRPIGD